jgi:hypothetical protein
VYRTVRGAAGRLTEYISAPPTAPPTTETGTPGAAVMQRSEQNRDRVNALMLQGLYLIAQVFVSRGGSAEAGLKYFQNEIRRQQQQQRVDDDEDGM